MKRRWHFMMLRSFWKVLWSKPLLKMLTGELLVRCHLFRIRGHAVLAGLSVALIACHQHSPLRRVTLLLMVINQRSFLSSTTLTATKITTDAMVVTKIGSMPQLKIMDIS
jgi:hypothetical protein